LPDFGVDFEFIYLNPGL